MNILKALILDDSRASELWQFIKAKLSQKQDKLAAGDGISITNNTIGVTTPTRGIFTQEEFDAIPESQRNSGFYVIDDGEEASFEQIAEAMKDFFLSGGVPYGKELTESWAALQTRIKAGNFKGIHIGDFKTITLTTGEKVVMEVAGIDQYYKCGDQQIGHHVDFISRDCLAGAKVFNDTNTNNGTADEPNPWRASKLFQTMNDETAGVIAMLPADLKPCIIQKRALLESRYSSAGALESSTSWAWNNMGKLWLPTEVEVFGNTFWSDGDAGWTGGGGCNKQYPIFIGGSLHLIKGNGNSGSRCYWWEASARRQSAAYVFCVHYDGSAYSHAAAYKWSCAPLCFRIG